MTSLLDFAADTPPPDHTAYLDDAAGSDDGRRYKQRALAALDVTTGQTVVDIGCGPGTDLLRLGETVGPTGTVLGIDTSATRTGAARDRTAGSPVVTVLRGDAHHLPLRSGTVDRARADRVLQHVPEPQDALAEVRRVLRPGGLLGMAEPDWDTLAIDDPDTATSRQFTRFISDRTENGTIGRQLPRLATRAGLIVRTVDPIAITFRDVRLGERILGLRRNAVRAVQAGYLTEAAARAWLSRLESGPTFLAGFVLLVVTAERD